MQFRTHHKIFYIFFVVIAMTLTFVVRGGNPATDNPHYHRLRFEDSSLPIQERIRHGDRLIALHQDDSTEIIRKCAELSLKGCRFQEADAYVTRMFDKYDLNADVAQRCGIMVLAAEIYMKSGNYKRAAEMAETVLATPKPDSLLYADMMVYEVLSYINILNPKLNGTYIEYAEAVYANAKRSKVNPATLRNMRRFLLSMRIRDALYKREFGISID